MWTLWTRSDAQSAPPDSRAGRGSSDCIRAPGLRALAPMRAYWNTIRTTHQLKELIQSRTATTGIRPVHPSRIRYRRTRGCNRQASYVRQNARNLHRIRVSALDHRICLGRLFRSRKYASWRRLWSSQRTASPRMSQRYRLGRLHPNPKPNTRRICDRLRVIMQPSSERSSGRHGKLRTAIHPRLGATPRPN